MKKLLTTCSLVVLLLTLSATTIADIAKPTPVPQKEPKVF
jgi:hypothetical protein